MLNSAQHSHGRRSFTALPISDFSTLSSKFWSLQLPKQRKGSFHRAAEPAGAEEAGAAVLGGAGGAHARRAAPALARAAAQPHAAVALRRHRRDPHARLVPLQGRQAHQGLLGRLPN